MSERWRKSRGDSKRVRERASIRKNETQREGEREREATERDRKSN